MNRAQIQKLINNNIPIAWQNSLSGTAFREILTDLNNAIFEGGIFNVLDYGAVGNGVANDIAALNSALAAASAAGGGTVYIPPGPTLAINASVTIPQNVNLVGGGVSSVIQQNTPSSITLNTPNPGVIIKDLYIRYNTQGTSGGWAINNTSTGDGQESILIKNVKIDKAQIGILNAANNYAREFNNIIYNATFAGIWIEGGSNNNVIGSSIIGNVSPSITHFSFAGIALTGYSTGNTIIGNEVFGVLGYNVVLDNDGTPGYSHSPIDNIFSGNFFDNSAAVGGLFEGYQNTFTGNWLSGWGWKQVAGNSNTYIGNIIANTAVDGFALNGGAHTVLSGNNISNNGSPANTYDGILVSANVTDFVITGNTITNIPGVPKGQRYAINVLAGTSDRYNITNNSVAGNGTGGVTDNGSGVNKLVQGNF